MNASASSRGCAQSLMVWMILGPTWWLKELDICPFLHESMLQSSAWLLTGVVGSEKNYAGILPYFFLSRVLFELLMNASSWGDVWAGPI